MFWEKYLNSTYISLVYDNYSDDYLKSLDENNFNSIYMLLKKYNFYFIEDIILNYLELFEMNYDALDSAISYIKSEMGDSFVKTIGKDMTVIDQIIELANKYDEQ